MRNEQLERKKPENHFLISCLEREWEEWEALYSSNQGWLMITRKAPTAPRWTRRFWLSSSHWPRHFVRLCRFFRSSIPTSVITRNWKATCAFSLAVSAITRTIRRKEREKKSEKWTRLSGSTLVIRTWNSFLKGFFFFFFIFCSKSGCWGLSNKLFIREWKWAFFNFFSFHYCAEGQKVLLGLGLVWERMDVKKQI